MRYFIFLFAASIAAAQSGTGLPVTLSWSNPNTVPTYVHIYRTTGMICPAATPANYKLIAPQASATGPWTDTTVNAGTTYCWYAAPYPTLGGADGPPSAIFQQIGQAPPLVALAGFKGN
jgi:hypothetical protein